MGLIFILVGIDPFLQPGVHSIHRFDIESDAYEYMGNWLHEKLTAQQNGFGGLRGNIQLHQQKYLNRFKLDKNIYYYGEFKNYTTSIPYEYKWELYSL